MKTTASSLHFLLPFISTDPFELLDARLSLTNEKKKKKMQSLHPSISSAARQSKTYDRVAAVFLGRAAPNRLLPRTRPAFPANTSSKHPTPGSRKAVDSKETWNGEKKKLPQGVHRWQRKTEFEYHLQFRSQCLYNLPLQCLAESC